MLNRVAKPHLEAVCVKWPLTKTRLKEVIFEKRPKSKPQATDVLKYVRVDNNALCLKTVPESGPDWKTVLRRRSSNVKTGEIIVDIDLKVNKPTFDELHR